MYVRFVTQFTNEDGEPETGIFQAAGHIRGHSFTHNDDVAKLKLLNGWFNTYLEKPNRLSNATSKSPAAISLSWYKDSAKQHLFKMQELIEILEKYDLIVERLISKNPGYVVYEDEYQVSAIPFKTDRNRVV